MYLRRNGQFLTLFLIGLLIVPYVGLLVDVSPNTHQDSNFENNITLAQTGWLTGWQYRKSHTMTGSAGAETDYQVRITVHRTTGIDSGENIYVGSNCKTDFGDIRFTSDDGVTLLDYWMEELASENASFWVEVKENLDTNQGIHVYYGNTEATSASDGSATFIFFDDFEDGTLDGTKWDAFGPWTESGGMATFSITSTGDAIDFPSIRTNSAWNMRNKAFAARWQFDENSVNRQFGMSCSTDNGAMLSYFIGGTYSDTVSDVYFDLNHASSGYDHDANVIMDWPVDTFFRTEFISTPDGPTKNDWRLDFDSVSTYNGGFFSTDLQRIRLAFYAHGFHSPLGAGTLTMDFDWVYLRKAISTEPIHSSWGSEESQATTTSTTSTTTTPIPTGPFPQDIPIFLIIAIISPVIIVVLAIGWYLRSRGRIETSFGYG